MKHLRQGQTIYYIDQVLWRPGADPELKKIFLHSQNEPLPPAGVIVERCPVTLAREAQAKGFKFYTSRRKAVRALIAQSEVPK